MIVNKKDAYLVFQDKTVIQGYGIGAKKIVTGELCFNTSITGYQEILTDPSYTGQIINFTFPHIGNVGTNDDDVESAKCGASGLIIRENITKPSNYRSQNHLNDWLIKNDLTGICGVDTRQITHLIRKTGGQNVAIIFDYEFNLDEIVQNLKANPNLKNVELAKQVTCQENYPHNGDAHFDYTQNKYLNKQGAKHIIAIDFGIKTNILRNFANLNCKITIIPATASFDEIKALNPDGVFLSNGPGDPAATSKYANDVIKKILDANIPLFGICLGHQLLAIAAGAKTIKMHQGHRGGNQPVANLANKKVEITSQNHGFCVDENTLPDNIQITHRSLFDNIIEGIKLKDKNAFSIQYHPESSPGPNDSLYLFEEFVKNCH